MFPWEHSGYEGAIYTHSKTWLIVGHLCSWARLWRTVSDSYPVPTDPKEQALNYLKGKRAARLKIKEEKTFQRELFTGHDSRASDVPLQPGSQLQNVSPSQFFFSPASQSSLCNTVRSCRLTYFIITPEMSAQTTLCHLPKLLWILTVAFTVEAYTSPGWWKWHLLLAEVWRGRRELPFGKAIRSTLRVWPSRVYMQ